MPVSEYSDYVNPKKTNKSVSLNKLSRSENSLSLNSHNSFSYAKRKRIRLPQNDFDSSTVKKGIDEIDLEMEDIENNMPDSVYDNDDGEIEELMSANLILRQKVKEIADLVVGAIKKACILK